ncbi:Ubiquitin-associated domain-containing protein 1 [Homalodisca vitripennis]|nr:Ubiquitin-associated domain-containing protein 1 [Homalodisca vitripennis]
MPSTACQYKKLHGVQCTSSVWAALHFVVRYTIVNSQLTMKSVLIYSFTDEVLLIAKRHIGFSTPVQLTPEDTKGPSKEEIVAATAHLNKQNSILVVPSFDCQESFQSEIRKVLYSLVEASAKVLAQSPDAKIVFDGIAARINAKNKKEIDKNAVKYLKDLGFTEVQARYALRLKRNRQIEAMEWLLENSHRVKEEPQEKAEEASASTLDTSSYITGDNPLHTINKLLRDIRDFHYRHFEPSPKALETLQNMGFSQDDVVEALRVTGNNQVLACEWLCGERDPAVTQPDAGLDPEGQLYKALMNNPAIQLGLHNPKIMLALKGKAVYICDNCRLPAFSNLTRSSPTEVINPSDNGLTSSEHLKLLTDQIFEITENYKNLSEQLVNIRDENVQLTSSLNCQAEVISDLVLNKSGKDLKSYADALKVKPFGIQMVETVHAETMNCDVLTRPTGESRDSSNSTKGMQLALGKMATNTMMSNMVQQRATGDKKAYNYMVSQQH